MNIYLVGYVPGGCGFTPEAVFSTRELAQEYVDSKVPHTREIAEYILDYAEVAATP